MAETTGPPTTTPTPPTPPTTNGAGGGTVWIYSSSGCAHCGVAKQRLAELALPFVEINLTEYPERRHEMFALSKKKTVPQIFFNDTHFGGASTLKQLDDERVRALVTEALAAPAGTLIAPPPLLLLPSSLSEDNEKLSSVVVDDAASSSSSSSPLPTAGGSDAKPGAGATTAQQRHNVEEIEMNTLFDRLRDKQSGVKLKDRMHKFKLIRHSFRGKDLLAWLQHSLDCDAAQASLVATRLIERLMFHRVDASTRLAHRWDVKGVYRFSQDHDKFLLNMKWVWKKEARDAVTVSQEVQQRINHLADRYIRPTGVDYAGIGRSKEFKLYCSSVMELQKVDMSTLAERARAAFFINIYNALVIHAQVTVGPPSNALERFRFFNKYGYLMGGYKFTLNDMEHGVLRANSKAPGALRVPFSSSSDPRRRFCVSATNPCIHFALVCGARSCPPVRVYSAENIDEALTLAADGYVSEEVSIDYDARKVKLPMLFKWYMGDFDNGTEHGVLRWIGQFMRDEPRYAALLADLRSVRVSFKKYNWTANSAEVTMEGLQYQSSTVNENDDADADTDSFMELLSTASHDSERSDAGDDVEEGSTLK